MLPRVRPLSPLARRQLLRKAVSFELARLRAIREAVETDPEPGTPVAVEDEPGTERVAGESNFAVVYGRAA